MKQLAVSPRELARLRAEYDATHWCDDCAPREVSRWRAPDPSKPMVELGALYAVTYLTIKGNELALWEHEFRRRARPVLAFNKTGLVIVGGDYRVTPAGIEG